MSVNIEIIPREIDELASGTSEQIRKAVRTAYVQGLEEGKKRSLQKGIQLGIEQERSRVMKAINPDASTEKPTTAPRTNGVGRAAASYGHISNLARRMLAADRAAKFDADITVRYFAEKFQTMITHDQARTTLKVLNRAEEAERVERGQYRAGPKLAQVLPLPTREGKTETAATH